MSQPNKKLKSDEHEESRKRSLFNPTLKDIQSDKLTKIANEHWVTEDKSKFSNEVVSQIYKDLEESNFDFGRVMLLEYSQYLEKFLWPNFDENSSLAHLISIVLMVNEKARERVPMWESFKKQPAMFPVFFRKVTHEILSKDNSLQIKCFLLIFLIHCFQNLAEHVIRQECLKHINVTCWTSLIPARRQVELKKVPKLEKHYNNFEKQLNSSDEAKKEQLLFEWKFFSQLLRQFIDILNSVPAFGEVPSVTLKYLERFLEFLIDLQSQLLTRRYLSTLFSDHQIMIHCLKSNVVKRKDASLFRELFNMLKFYTFFEINEHTGSQLTDNEILTKHSKTLNELQRIAFKNFPELREFALSPLAAIESRDSLLKHLNSLSEQRFKDFCDQLYVRRVDFEGNDLPRAFVTESIVFYLEKRPSQLESINNTPLYPTEIQLWDDAVIKTEFYTGEHCLALPKLNLQFLTMHDYLWRNFNLFRLEANYEIRQDIEDAVQRMSPQVNREGGVDFTGWARMSTPIQQFSVIDIGKPKLGDIKPGHVKAEVTFSISKYTDMIQREWDEIRPHDVLFLVSIKPHESSSSSEFRSQYGVEYVRGCEVCDILGPDGKPLDDFQLLPKNRPLYKNKLRTFRVLLDPSQYYADIQSTLKGKEDVNAAFNLLIRRKPKENNFKAVLETIRDLMQTDCSIPSWLHDIFLGYGDPSAAHYSLMPNKPKVIDFYDTFLDDQHLKESFPKEIVEVESKNSSLFKLQFEKDQEKSIIHANDYKLENRGPYPFNQPKRNTVHFTPTQIEAIRAGTHPGLTMVVGPPGTGKTDVAVQIISNLYHSFPEQHTLVITHSNQALNQIFEKVINLDIDERHCLRLGHGVEEIETEQDFSRYGRVDHFLAKRIELLAEVDRLAKSLNIPGDHGYTCETASYFFLYHIEPIWNRYLEKLAKMENLTGEDVSKEFPFTIHFQNAPQPLFPEGVSFEKAIEIAQGCFSGHLKNVFSQLEEMRPFELLKFGSDRANYLLTKEAKIIAMTCTHAALKRRELVNLAFKYDNVIMEESAQILEIETFIPLLLQKDEDNNSRLKRVILIGDHNQLPPVVKNMSFQRYANMEQSLFSRFVQLGVPTIDLDAQGRARPSISELYSWRYKNLGNLPVVQKNEYLYANSGFCHEYQLIDVGDFNGNGESEPLPHFYQNLGEAEYIVAVYQYMRLIGYPAEKITILTTYNGQKDLIRDVINQRCSRNPLFGRPHRIATVDKYQGQQNDYILLSLVRTKSVGHIRDARRLIVAMSRARLGLYIFCRKSLFQNCFELAPSFNLLLKKPVTLALNLGETFPSTRPLNEQGKPTHFDNVVPFGQFVYQMTLEQTSRLQRLFLENSQPTDVKMQEAEEEKKEENEKRKEIDNEENQNNEEQK